MKLILPLLAIATTCLADSCDNTYEAYLKALKDAITHGNNQQGLEEESKSDFHSLVRKCFATSSSDQSKCVLTDEELAADPYGDDGPMKGCDRCQKMIKGFVDKFLHSKESVRKCLRTHFADAVREELEPCIQGKISNGYNWHCPQIPDFDENTLSRYMEIAKKDTEQRICAYSRLDACRAVNPAKYQNTAPCMAKGYPGIYAKHCQVSKYAKSKSVSGSCAARFAEVKGAACGCLLEKRQLWHQKFGQTYKIVTTSTSANQCAKDISNVLGVWLGKIQKALSDCVPNTEENQKQRDLRTLIELGCGQVVNGGVKKNELTTGFRFIRLFLDALNDRILVYCDRNCNY